MFVAIRVVPLILLAACATEPQTHDATTLAASATERQEKVVCGKEEPTGSRLRVRRCWTQEQLDQEERDAEALVKRGQLVRPAPVDPRGR